MSTAKHEIRITQSDPATTLIAGTANVATVIARFTVPDRTRFVIRAGDVMSLSLSDTTPTAIAGTSLVRVYVSDPNGVRRDLVAQADFTVFTEFRDRNLMFAFGQETLLDADDRMEIEATANLAIATAQTRFQISALRSTRLTM